MNDVTVKTAYGTYLGKGEDGIIRSSPVPKIRYTLAANVL